MAAILGLSDEDVRAACAEAAQGEVVEPVNFNAPAQVVIAGLMTHMRVAYTAEGAFLRGDEVKQILTDMVHRALTFGG